MWITLCKPISLHKYVREKQKDSMKENRRVANESWSKGLRQHAAVIPLL